MTDNQPAIDQTREDLARRLIALGEDEATARESATFMINNWDYFSSNSVDDRGHETCRDWMDEEVARLLDRAALSAIRSARNARWKIRECSSLAGVLTTQKNLKSNSGAGARTNDAERVRSNHGTNYSSSTEDLNAA